MKPIFLFVAISCVFVVGCEDSADREADDDDSTAGDADSDSDTDTEYNGPPIPETCEQAEQATTTVGCLFYAVDLDAADSVETSQYAVAISNVNTSDTAMVTVSQGGSGGWTEVDSVAVPPMDLHVFNLPDYHQNWSGVMDGGSYRIESDVPIIAYQFSPVDGSMSYLSDASMLIPVTSLSLTYDIVGWKQNDCSGVNPADGTMRAYFTVVATVDGTEILVEPSSVPIAGSGVPAQTSPFSVSLEEGDVLEVATNAVGNTMSGSRVTANEGHPIVVFSGQECAYIPATTCCCDHLEEQLPGLRFWGKQMVAARMPPRGSSGEADQVMWQIYASENGTTVTLSASPGVTGLPASPLAMEAGDIQEFFVTGPVSTPGDFFVQADKPIGVMQYMTAGQGANALGVGDPAMVYTSPTEQFLPRYVVLVPGTWQNDALVITRHAGVGVLLDDEPIPDSEFVAVAGSGFEVARHMTPDGVHTLRSENEEYGLAVVVVGWDMYDSYAYMGGMGMGEINPGVE